MMSKAMTRRGTAAGHLASQGARTCKKADTESLRRLNEVSIRKGYNRSLSDKFFVDADPDGTHVLMVLMVHEHAQMRPVRPHFRCLVLAKMRGKRMPTEVLLDIPMEAFHRLCDARARSRIA